MQIKYFKHHAENREFNELENELNDSAAVRYMDKQIEKIHGTKNKGSLMGKAQVFGLGILFSYAAHTLYTINNDIDIDMANDANMAVEFIIENGSEAATAPLTNDQNFGVPEATDIQLP